MQIAINHGEGPPTVLTGQQWRLRQHLRGPLGEGQGRSWTGRRGQGGRTLGARRLFLPAAPAGCKGGADRNSGKRSHCRRGWGPRGAGRTREGHSERGEALLFFRVSASRGRGCTAVGPGRPAVGRPFSLAEEARPHACAVNPQCSLFLPSPPAPGPRWTCGHSTWAAGPGAQPGPAGQPAEGKAGSWTSWGDGGEDGVRGEDLSVASGAHLRAPCRGSDPNACASDLEHRAAGETTAQASDRPPRGARRS